MTTPTSDAPATPDDDLVMPGMLIPDPAGTGRLVWAVADSPILRRALRARREGGVK
jgi:hypothetical protein